MPSSIKVLFCVIELLLIEAVCGQVSDVVDGRRKGPQTPLATVEAYISTLRDAMATDEARYRAALHLKMATAESAIGPLLDNLLIQHPSQAEVSPLAGFPAAEALVKYEEPLYPKVWEALQQRRSRKYLYVLAYTLTESNHSSPLRPLRRVKGRLNEESHSVIERGNLSVLLSFLERLDITNVKAWPPFVADP